MPKAPATPTPENVSLKMFDIKKMPRNSTVLIYGKRRSGKSVLVKNIMYKHRDIPRGVVVSQSEGTSPFYQKFIPSSYIFDKYESTTMGRIFSQQQALVKKEGGPAPSNNFFIIMDDVLADVSSWKKDETINNAMFNGRHVNLFFVIVMQYCLALPPAIRSNFDYVFIFKDIIPANRRRLYENFAGIIPSFAIFNKVMDAVTDDHGCLVIELCGNSNSWTDCVYWLKANIIEKKFRVGCEEYWRVHDEHYKGYQDEELSSANDSGIHLSGNSASGSTKEKNPLKVILRPMPSGIRHH